MFKSNKKQKTESNITNQARAIYSEIDKIWEKDLDLNNKSTNSLAKTDKTYLIPPTDGKENISNSPGMFKLVFLDKEEIQKSDFVSKSTDSINGSVYILIDDSTIYKMFKSFGDDLNLICFTQSQILTFLKKYKNELVGTWHFLFRAKDEFMFMQVCMDDDGSMRLFGGDFSEDGLNYVYPATGVNFRFLVPETKTVTELGR